MRNLAIIGCILCLTGCDLVGTTATTAAGASAELQQAKGAKKTEDQVKQQVQSDLDLQRARVDQTEKDAQ